MEDGLDDFSTEAILGRFDKTTPQTLLASIAQELHRLARANAVLTARLTAMEALQTIIDRIGSASVDAEMAALPASILIDASYSIPGAWGFHKLEYDAMGRPYRWTGPEQQFSFQFFFNRLNPAEFALKFYRIYGTYSAEDLRCFVDGQEVPTKLAAGAGANVLTGQLSPRATPGGTVLTFICPGMNSPASLEGNADERLLGLSFESLSVISLPVDVAQPIKFSKRRESV